LRIEAAYTSKAKKSPPAEARSNLKEAGELVLDANREIVRGAS
jgi:hypothetical protein